MEWLLGAQRVCMEDTWKACGGCAEGAPRGLEWLLGVWREAMEWLLGAQKACGGCIEGV